MKEKVQDSRRVVSAPAFKPIDQRLHTEESYIPSSSAPAMGPTLEQIVRSLRTEAPYVSTALCSLSLAITGEEPASTLLESLLDTPSFLTEEEVYAALNIEPKLFLGKKCAVSQFKNIVLEIIKVENGFLTDLKGIAKELQSISTWGISNIDKRFIQGFLTKLNPVIDEQELFCQHIAECYRQLFPINDVEKATALALAKTKALAEAKTANEKVIADLETIAETEATEHAKAIAIANEEGKVDAEVIAEITASAESRAKEHAATIANVRAIAEARKKAIEEEYAEQIAYAGTIVNAKAIDFFLALYEPENFKRKMQALLQFIDDVDDWFKMDNRLQKHKEQCEANRKNLRILAQKFEYAFGASMVQMLSRRLLLAADLLKALKLKDCAKQEDIQKCYEIMAYIVQRAQMLRAFKDDGYIHSKAQQSLKGTYFNPNAKNTVMHFLTDEENASQKEHFVNFIKQHGASAHLQFFQDIYALFKKKPLYVTDLQLLAPYFDVSSNPLGLKKDVLVSIRNALYSENVNQPEKIKQIIAELIPAIETVGSMLVKMLKDFLGMSDLANQADRDIESFIAPIPKRQSKQDKEIRNVVARELFKREIRKQIELLQAADIFHDACFKDLVSRLCLEVLEPLLAAEKDDLSFLSCYARILLGIPYYLLETLPQNFTEKNITKQTILSYNFCEKLDPETTGLNLESLTACLRAKKTDYEASQQEFLSQMESSTSVFELFNRLKDRSDPTPYITLKEEIRDLNRTSASLWVVEPKKLVAKTPAITSRIRGDKPLENSGPSTPSKTATPFVPATVAKLRVISAATPLRSKAVATEKESSFFSALLESPSVATRTPVKTPSTPQSDTAVLTPTSTAEVSPNKTGFTKFVNYVKQKWQIKQYEKAHNGDPVPCKELAKCHLIHVYDKAKEDKLIFTAERNQRQTQWSVAAHSHEEEYVQEMVSFMAEAVEQRRTMRRKENPTDGITPTKTEPVAAPRTILDIAISATEEKECLDLIAIYVGAAMEKGVFPRVTLNPQPTGKQKSTLNPQPLTSKDLHDKLLKRNKDLAGEYQKIADSVEKSLEKISGNPHALLSAPQTVRPNKSARRALFKEDIEKPGRAVTFPTRFSQ